MAVDDLPIVRMHCGSPLPKDRERMYWLGESDREYQFRTLQAIVRKGYAQYLPNGVNNDGYTAIDHIYSYKADGYKMYNDLFLSL